MKSLVELLHHVPNETCWFWLTGFLLGLISLWFYFIQHKKGLFYLIFFLGVLCFGFGFSLLDPYLNEWDEQFHALVGKNLAENPLMPVLIKTSPEPLNYQIWTYNHIWLHKQPLFLWQIALSIKLFGANVLAVRLPSVVLHAATSVLLVSIGKRFLDIKYAVFAGFLFAYSGYYNDFVSGAIGMDHNDVGFTFYIIASLWAWLKLRENPNQFKWIVIIGVLGAGAVLTKWLTGLLVFGSWGLIILVENRTSKKDWKSFVYSLIIACFIFIPWQLYCYFNFPKEFLNEMNYNSKHFLSCIENHCGSTLYYWNNLKFYVGSGDVNKWIVVIGFLFMIRKALIERGKWLFFTFSFAFFFFFFTVAATKMEGYILPVAPFAFIMLLYPIQQLMNYIIKRKNELDSSFKNVVAIVSIGIITFLYFNANSIIDRHKYAIPEWRAARINSLKYIRKVVQENPNASYFLIKGEQTNLIPNAIFNNGRPMVVYNTKLERLIMEKGLAFVVIDVSKF